MINLWDFDTGSTNIADYLEMADGHAK